MDVKSPSTLEQLRESLRERTAKTRLISGGTDLTLHIRAHPEEEIDLIDISRIAELKEITLNGDLLEIGSATPFDEIEHSLIIRDKATTIAIASSQVGSTQIRSRGTLGGNLANASGAADGIPALCSMEALAMIEDSNGETFSTPVSEVIKERGKTILKEDQFIKKFTIKVRKNTYSDFAKVGSRKAVTISKLNIGFSCQIENGVKNPRIFIGAIAPSPTRCSEAEKILESKGGKEDFLNALTKTIDSTIPGRSSLKYKRTAIRGLGDDIWDRLGDVLNDSK